MCVSYLVFNLSRLRTAPPPLCGAHTWPPDGSMNSADGASYSEQQDGARRLAFLLNHAVEHNDHSLIFKRQ